ncbi:MAG: hypothetical protein R3F62_28725 [Planctomycetota bacterium]
MAEEEPGPESLTGKILALGLGAYFLTEDTVRRYVKDAKIPRDIARSITQNASKGKGELYGFIARELSDFLKQMDLQEELDRFVRTHKVKVSAEIEFLPRDPDSKEKKVDLDVKVTPPPPPRPPEPPADPAPE